MGGGDRGRAFGLMIVRMCAGVSVFFFGFERASWVLDSTPLATQLSSWLTEATPVSRWYLERIIPGAPVFARLIPLGSMLGGLALAVGFWTRMAAGLSLLMILSLQLAAASMFRYEYLTDGSGLPLVGALIGLLIGGGQLPWSVRR